MNPADALEENSPNANLKLAFSSTGFITDGLAAIAALREQLAEQEAHLVFELRMGGASWQQIANVTGMKSRQAAQHRYEKSAGRTPSA